MLNKNIRIILFDTLSNIKTITKNKLSSAEMFEIEKMIEQNFNKITQANQKFINKQRSKKEYDED